MYRKILLAYDGTASGIAALRESAALARLCEAELHLLGIVATSGFNAMAEGFGADIWGMERKSLEDALHAASAELNGSGVKVRSSISEGDPASVIIAGARTLASDLLVIGHSGKGAISRWLMGSVGHAVLNQLPCSLLIVAETGPR